MNRKLTTKEKQLTTKMTTEELDKAIEQTLIRVRAGYISKWRGIDEIKMIFANEINVASKLPVECEHCKQSTSGRCVSHSVTDDKIVDAITRNNYPLEKSGCTCHCHGEPQVPKGVQCKCIKNCIHCNRYYGQSPVLVKPDIPPAPPVQREKEETPSTGETNRMHWTLEQWKTSKNIIDRTVWFINTLSPWNLWKGYDAIKEIEHQAKQEAYREFEEIIGKYEKVQGFDEYYGHGLNHRGDYKSYINEYVIPREERNKLRSELRTALKELEERG